MLDLDPNDDPVTIGAFAVEECIELVREVIGEVIALGDEFEDPQRPREALKSLQTLQRVEQQLRSACEAEREARRERFAAERAKQRAKERRDG